MSHREIIRTLVHMYYGRKEEYMKIVEKINIEDFLEIELILSKWILKYPLNQNLSIAYKSMLSM